MKVLSVFLIFGILLLICPRQLKAQSKDLSFYYLTSDNGLSHNRAWCILRDSHDNVWIGTTDGLNRYNSCNVIEYKNRPNDPSSISFNGITDIVEDGNQNIWVATGNGLNRYDYEKDDFTQFDLAKLNNSPNSTLVNCLFCDRDKNIWIGLNNGKTGLNKWDPRSQKFTQYVVGGSRDRAKANMVTGITQDKDGYIWIASMADGIIRFDPKRSTFNCFEDPTANISNCPKRLCLDNENTIWISALSVGLVSFNTSSKSFTKYGTAGDGKGTNGKTLYNVTQEDRDHLLIAVDQGGLNRMDKRTKTFEYIKCDPKNPTGLNSNGVCYVYKDKEGLLWVGTSGGGVNINNPKSEKFKLIKKAPGDPNSLSYNFVSSIYEDSKGLLWIATDGGGINVYDPQTKNFTIYMNNPKDPSSIPSNVIRNVVEDKNHIFWIGTWKGGLIKFDPKTKKFTRFMADTPNPFDISDPTVWHSTVDHKGMIWLCINQVGIDILDPYQGTIKKIRPNPSIKSEPSNKMVNFMYEDSHHNMWICTREGLNRYDSTTNSFKAYKGIPGDYIISFLEDREGCYWAGSLYKGLIRFKPDGTILKTYNASTGFTGNGICGLLEDSEGCIWASTNDGIFKIDYKKGKWKQFTVSDGLQGRQFYYQSFMKAKSGDMFFGGYNGLNYFTPKNIKDNSFVPKVYINEFLLFNKPVGIGTQGSPLTKCIEHTQNLELKWDQSVFSFGFIAVNYTHPERNQYAYKMEGFDKEWNKVGSKRTATYTNLPAGKYKFRVIASNNDGVWNQEGTTLTITILPPPWKTWWAFMIYVAMIAFLLNKYRQTTTQRIQREKERELDQMKLNLFVNVSHEFRTPLTLMQNPLDKIKESNNIEEIHSLAETAQRSSAKLLNLVNQLLDFRKIDQGKTTIKVSPIKIVSFCQQTYEVFNNMAKAKNIQLSFVSNETEIEVWLDPDKLDKILDNILSNAFKFTESGGSIRIEIGLVGKSANDPSVQISTPSKSDTYAEISISDTGIGLKTEELKNIFERFYQVDTTKAGTGIGLNYVKSLMELLGGEIAIESVYGKGSTFRLRFPLGNEHFKAKNAVLVSQPKFEYRKDKLAKEAFLYDIENFDDTPLMDEGEEERAEGVQKKQLVLLVEDSKSLRIQIRKELEEQYIVREAIHGLDGKEKALKYMPDLIVSDIMMPKMDGIEMCKQLKSDVNTCHIPIILLTAKGSLDDKIAGFETGADEYLSKPFSVKLLEVRIQNLIQNRITLRNKYQESKVLGPSKEFTTNNLDEQFLERITKFVIESISDPKFMLDDLREKMGMSQTAMFVKLQSLTGQNPSTFVRTVRLKYAENLLVQNQKSIKSICYECGFNTPAYFAKLFKEQYGQTPSDYLESYLEKKKKGEAN